MLTNRNYTHRCILSERREKNKGYNWVLGYVWKHETVIVIKNCNNNKIDKGKGGGGGRKNGQSQHQNFKNEERKLQTPLHHPVYCVPMLKVTALLQYHSQHWEPRGDACFVSNTNTHGRSLEDLSKHHTDFMLHQHTSHSRQTERPQKTSLGLKVCLFNGASFSNSTAASNKYFKVITDGFLVFPFPKTCQLESTPRTVLKRCLHSGISLTCRFLKHSYSP